MWGLCGSLLAFPCLRVGALLACGVSGASSLRSLQSRLPFVVCPSFLSLFVLHLLLRWVGWSQVCGTSCCSCVWSSGGVSVAPFCRLGLLSHPLLLLFLAWVSAFGVCSDLGWWAAVLPGFLPSFRGELSFPCPGGFRLAVPTVGCPGYLRFLHLCWGSFLSLPVFADS